MTANLITGPVRSALQRSRLFIECQRGIAAVEFGLIVPIMLVMFIGVVELSQAITVDRRVSQVASSTADLVARQKTVTTTQLAGYMQVIEKLMAPYRADIMKVTITNVYATTANPTNFRVCWSYPWNQGAVPVMNTGDIYPSAQVPNGIIQGGTSVVVVDVAYNYAPTLLFRVGSYVGAGYNLTERFFLKPRLSASIQLGAATACV